MAGRYRESRWMDVTFGKVQVSTADTAVPDFDA
jgi:hypothetical protein